VQEIPYLSLVWLTYRLAATFAVGLPLVLLLWASIRNEGSMVRLLTIYWKVASLLFISMLLLTDQKPLGFLTLFLAPLLIVISVWFWVDLNEELADLPPWRPLPFTVRLWRSALTGFCLIASLLSSFSLSCISNQTEASCQAWLEAPLRMHRIFEGVFNFLFGGQWTEPVAAFIGYLGLLAYVVGFMQWLLVRLPKQGRIAGEF